MTQSGRQYSDHIVWGNWVFVEWLVDGQYVTEKMLYGEYLANVKPFLPPVHQLPKSGQFRQMEFVL